MPFPNIPGLPGKLYVPRPNPDAPEKHHCPDCFSCQMCSDDRCRNGTIAASGRRGEMLREAAGGPAASKRKES